MAPSVGTLRVGRYFMALVLIFLALYAVVGLGSRQTPKLGIDLVGGKRVIFQARTTNGSTPSSDSMSQARQIIEDRVNGQGVTGSIVQVQNGNQLVVTIPGGTNTDVHELGEPAILNFRGVMAPAQLVTCGSKTTPTTTPTSTPATSTSSPSSTAPSSPTSTTSASSKATTKPTTATTQSGNASGAAGNAFADRPLTAGQPSTAPKRTGTPKATGTATPTVTPTLSPTVSPTVSSAPTPNTCEADPIGALFKTDPGLKKVMPNAETCPSPALASGTPCRAFTSLSSARQTELMSALSRYKCSAAQGEADTSTSYYLACDDGKSLGVPAAYLLGHVVVAGSDISSASSVAPGSNGTTQTSTWSVNLNLTGSGGDKWGSWTSKYHYSDPTANLNPIQTSATSPCGPSATVPCSDFVGFTLNGQVIAAPLTEATLTTQTNISGNYDQTSADALTMQLNYGKLPLSFKPVSNESVSATLGSVQLKGALLAGGIGLVLVVLYSLAYYRGLGLITVASLLVSAGLTYAMLVILGTQIGFTLDLAGIAGFIVALGITADSFVVFFERIKDEVHEGRSMRVAVPRAWIRARRTILSADTVSFFAAAILYYFAAADVKGFAFTLGLSTILDLVVVFLFTHPIVSVLSRSAAFGSPRFTGLNSVRTGPAIADDDAGRETARRARPARTAALSARERAAGRRGIAVHDPATNDETAEPVEDAVDEPVDEPGRDVPPPSGGTAAERAAARRARRETQSEDEGDA